MTQRFGTYDISDELARVDLARVHGWLTTAYWSPGITRPQVEKAAAHSSLVLGAYAAGDAGAQAGYLRVVSDRVRIAYVCDVFVDDAHRGRGLARALARSALDHPDYRDVRRWLLVTRDAHGVYAEVGFEPLPQPERWMAYLPPTGERDESTTP